MFVSSYYYIGVLILLCMSSYCYVYVLILLYMCLHFYLCPHSTERPHTTIHVPSYCYVCVLILLCVQAADLMASMIWKKMGQKAFVLSEQAKGPSPLANSATADVTPATPA